MIHGLDKYGRTLADVILPDGTNVNQELVKQGWCWCYYGVSGLHKLGGMEAESDKEKQRGERLDTA